MIDKWRSVAAAAAAESDPEVERGGGEQAWVAAQIEGGAAATNPNFTPLGNRSGADHGRRAHAHD